MGHVCRTCMYTTKKKINHRIYLTKTLQSTHTNIIRHTLCVLLSIDSFARSHPTMIKQTSASHQSRPPPPKIPINKFTVGWAIGGDIFRILLHDTLVDNKMGGVTHTAGQELSANQNSTSATLTLLENCCGHINAFVSQQHIRIYDI